MKTLFYIFMASLLIAVSAMAAPQPKAQNIKCEVQSIGSMSDTGGDGSPIDVVSLKCHQKAVSALVFSQSQSMLLEMAKKQGKSVGVKFEKIDRKRLAIGEIDFN